MEQLVSPFTRAAVGAIEDTSQADLNTSIRTMKSGKCFATSLKQVGLSMSVLNHAAFWRPAELGALGSARAIFSEALKDEGVKISASSGIWKIGTFSKQIS